MSAFRLHIEDFDAVDFDLIAIHTSLEDFRLAYFINKVAEIRLSKEENDVLIKNREGESGFTRFCFEDEENHVLWTLVQNQNSLTVTNTNVNRGLFEDTNDTLISKVYLLPEFKKVDYFLKIENDFDPDKLPELITQINTIDRVTMVYPIEMEQLKSKNNLIF